MKLKGLVVLIQLAAVQFPGPAHAYKQMGHLIDWKKKEQDYKNIFLVC